MEMLKYKISGNYTQFREWKLEKEKIEAEERKPKADKTIKATTEQGDNKRENKRN